MRRLLRSLRRRIGILLYANTVRVEPDESAVSAGGVEQAILVVAHRPSNQRGDDVFGRVVGTVALARKRGHGRCCCSCPQRALVGSAAGEVRYCIVSRDHVPRKRYPIEQRPTLQLRGRRLRHQPVLHVGDDLPLVLLHGGLRVVGGGRGWRLSGRPSRRCGDRSRHGIHRRPHAQPLGQVSSLPSFWPASPRSDHRRNVHRSRFRRLRQGGLGVCDLRAVRHRLYRRDDSLRGHDGGADGRLSGAHGPHDLADRLRVRGVRGSFRSV